MARSRRRNKAFKRSLLIYTCVAAVLCIVFLIYIFVTLKVYESNQASTFIKTYIKRLDDTTLKGYLEENNQSISLLSEYKKQINDKDVKVVKKGDNTFKVMLNDRELFNIETKTLKTETKLGMFSYDVREVTSIKPNLERGLVYVDVIVPSNYKVEIDGKVQESDKKEEYKNLSYMYANDSMPYMVTYEVNNLAKEANIKVTDEYGKDVTLKKNKFTYKLDKNYLTFDTYDDAKKYLSSEVDIWDFAHKWSLFLTKDLQGTSYGYSTIKTYFIEGTDMSKMAYNWAHNVDITFTSKHTLTNPPFTDEKLSNFVVYSKDAFSCEVYLVKHMIVNGKEQLDTMHDYIYFVKDNDVWKVVNIKAGE